MCFGDSNTYGENPNGLARFPYNVRWTGRLQSLLGSEYHIIEEGLNGRTISMDDNVGVNKNGKKHIEILLTTHTPLDLVVIMLGTNDLKVRFSLTARDIAYAMNDLIQKVLGFTQRETGKAPKVLVVAPSFVREETVAGESFGNQRKKSEDLTKWYEEIAKQNNVEFMTLLGEVEPSLQDGIHLTAESHEKVAELMLKKIKSII